MPAHADTDADRRAVSALTEADLVTDSVADFVPGPGFRRLDVRFDINELRDALATVTDRLAYQGQLADGFGVIAVTRRPGQAESTAADLSGRFWLRPDERYVEEPRDEVVDESTYTELTPEVADTYFAHVHETLSAIVPIGRVRVLWKAPYNANSWHRDPEPRIHVPITTNPGALMVINHHVTHLPADGSAYFTDTRGYHTAINGGETPRVHLVAAVAI